MVSSALLAATLTAAVAQARPDAVVLTSSPFITKPALTSSRTQAIYEASTGMREHLAERIEETWGIEPDATPPLHGNDSTFYVHLDWPGPERVVVGVALPEQTLVERSIEANDLETAMVMVWLLVRSTIDRALLRPNHQNSQDEPVRESAPIAVVSEGAPISISKPKRYGLSLMGLANLDTGAGATMTPSIQGRFFYSQWLTVGAELSFRHEERTELADIYHLPITAFVGARPWNHLPLELGLFTTLDVKFISLPNDNGGVGAGFYLGPYARGRWTFYSVGNSDFAAVGELGLGFALKRDRYYVGGETLTDGVVAFRLAGGLEWSWH